MKAHFNSWIGKCHIWSITFFVAHESSIFSDYIFHFGGESPWKPVTDSRSPSHSYQGLNPMLCILSWTLYIIDLKYSIWPKLQWLAIKRLWLNWDFSGRLDYVDMYETDSCRKMEALGKEIQSAYDVLTDLKGIPTFQPWHWALPHHPMPFVFVFVMQCMVDMLNLQNVKPISRATQIKTKKE